MAHLQDILYKVSIRSVHGELNRDVFDLQTDSRKVSPGSLFIAMRGTHVDGHQFIAQVTEMGATTIVCEELPADLRKEVTYVQVENSAAYLLRLAAFVLIIIAVLSKNSRPEP